MNTTTLPQLHIVPTFSIAFGIGKEDARSGAICCPEMLFAHPDDVRDYTVGYASVNGHNMTTRQILTDAQIEAEADDLAEEMLDREYHARGQW